MWSDHSRLDKSLYASKKGKGDSSKSGSGIKRTSSLPRTKGNEVKPERKGFWNGILATKLRQQEQEEGFDGFYRCTSGYPECESVIEGFMEAFTYFVPAHVKPRASFKTKGYRFGHLATLGPDDPDNVEPWCPECNRLEWQRRTA